MRVVGLALFGIKACVVNGQSFVRELVRAPQYEEVLRLVAHLRACAHILLRPADSVGLEDFVKVVRLGLLPFGRFLVQRLVLERRNLWPLGRYFGRVQGMVPLLRDFSVHCLVPGVIP